VPLAPHETYWCQSCTCCVPSRSEHACPGPFVVVVKSGRLVETDEREPRNGESQRLYQMTRGAHLTTSQSR
jgi:hypothetical protein